MKKSKILVLMLSLLMVFASALTLASCSEEVIEIDVNFSADDGKSIYRIVTTVQGEVVELPADPTKDGYDFAGWYYDVDCERPVEEGYVADEAITFYAKWVTHVHELEHTAAKEATCIGDGNVEYYYCALCNKYYDSESLAANQIPAAEIKVTDGSHKYNDDGECNYCKKDKNAISLSLNSDGSGYTYIGDGITDVDFVVIPSEYKELPITAIAANAFDGYDKVTEIVIPSSVVSIGAYAFRDCKALTSIVIPDSVTSIGNYAFYNCVSLTSIEFNAKECADLKTNNKIFATDEMDAEGSELVRADATLTIGVTVKAVPAYLFENCAFIKSVAFADDGVCEKIGAEAFANSGIVSIEVPLSVTEIAPGAFKGAALESISVAVGNENYIATGNCMFAKTEIGEGEEAVSGYNLILGSSDSVIPETVVELPVIGIADYAFYNCKNIKNVTIPATVKAIGAYAFYGCESLEELALTDGIESIGAFAAWGCASLKSITVPTTVTSIGKSAFYGCVSLETIDFNAENCADFEQGNLVFAYAQSEDVAIADITLTIGESVKAIPAYLISSVSSTDAVNSALSISEIIINAKDCESIGAYAFANATALKSIVYNIVNCADFTTNNYVFANAGIDAEGIKLLVGEEVKYIPAYLFAPDYSGMTSVNISEVEFKGTAIEKIGTGAFLAAAVTENSKVSYGTLEAWLAIEFSDTYSNPLCIGADMYIGGELLETLVIESGVVGNYTFAGCKSITALVINAESVGAYAFFGCSALETVEFGADVNEIAAYAFSACMSVDSVEFARSTAWALCNSYGKVVESFDVSDAEACAKAIANEKTGYTWKPSK